MPFAYSTFFDEMRASFFGRLRSYPPAPALGFIFFILLLVVFGHPSPVRADTTVAPLGYLGDYLYKRSRSKNMMSIALAVTENSTWEFEVLFTYAKAELRQWDGYLNDRNLDQFGLGAEVKRVFGSFFVRPVCGLAVESFWRRYFDRSGAGLPEEDVGYSRSQTFAVGPVVGLEISLGRYVVVSGEFVYDLPVRNNLTQGLYKPLESEPMTALKAALKVAF